MRVAIDTETSGLDPNVHGILTIALVKLDSSLNSVDMKHIEIQSEYKVIDPRAMVVNRIDLVKHNEIAQPRVMARHMVEHTLYEWSSNGEDPIEFLGHGVSFDIGFMKSLFAAASLERLEKIIGYRHIDTHSVLLTLRDSGIYKGNMKLEDACNYYNVRSFGTYHDARTDALAVSYLYKNIVQELKEMNTRDYD